MQFNDFNARGQDQRNNNNNNNNSNNNNFVSDNSIIEQINIERSAFDDSLTNENLPHSLNPNLDEMRAVFNSSLVLDDCVSDFQTLENNSLPEVFSDQNQAQLQQLNEPLNNVFNISDSHNPESVIIDNRGLINNLISNQEIQNDLLLANQAAILENNAVARAAISDNEGLIERPINRVEEIINDHGILNPFDNLLEFSREHPLILITLAAVSVFTIVCARPYLIRSFFAGSQAISKIANPQSNNPIPQPPEILPSGSARNPSTIGLWNIQNFNNWFAGVFAGFGFNSLFRFFFKRWRK